MRGRYSRGKTVMLVEESGWEAIDLGMLFLHKLILLTKARLSLSASSYLYVKIWPQFETQYNIKPLNVGFEAKVETSLNRDTFSFSSFRGLDLLSKARLTLKIVFNYCFKIIKKK
ncbi:hypothetical protein SADUNF_Sadunf18G0106300 [Salix dunnii]|uniref:Uncharacterized protein n=1 Tax=Salix dunnii TaxID=1413687 RepID=A0A835J3Q1_9ROSI|nr:hypothetical protein SADUNF_Sadunf18G0106300 [Salix dunnii]